MGWSVSPLLWPSIIVVSSIFVQVLWEEMNVFVRAAKAGGAGKETEGDGKKHRGRDWDLKNKSENKQRELKYKKVKKGPVSSLTKPNSNAAFVNNRGNICFLQQTLSKYLMLSLCLEPLRQTQLFKYFRMYFSEWGPNPVPNHCKGFPRFQRVMASSLRRCKYWEFGADRLAYPWVCKKTSL